MRPQIERAAALLIAGRHGRAVLAELALAMIVLASLWVAACMFVAMEPLP